MADAYYEAIIAYKSAMVQAGQMLLKGLITEQEYAIIETKMRERFGINSCSLFRDIDWINTDFRGNMSPTKEVV